ncbi:DUF6197 family protein [Streptomyces catenulae]|uniref:Uncharacterized protein n=1 Tax=Streptomyces catenulae TaxID=66875 RepID=A0ABV2YVZ8_9ACTN|nr:hypothetical protein [Streptomyces catenulae]
MPVPELTVTALDRAAARLVDTGPGPCAGPETVRRGPVRPDHRERAAWEGIAAGWARTAPADPAARRLIRATVDELVAEALRAVPRYGTRPDVEVRLPGRFARALPDWAHRRRPDLSHRPSTQLAVTAEILRTWGWQQRPHRLRDRRGRRCVCGALLGAVALGVGSEDAAERAAAHILGELRHRGWQALIGDWNAVPGRTREQAVALVTAARGRALAAGE